MKAAETKLFLCLLDATASMWRRQVLIYTMFPWKLLAILDPDISEEEAVALVKEFLGLWECCCDDGVTLVWLRQFGKQTALHLLQAGSSFRAALLLLALSKVTNIEIEDNFARASTARSANRGHMACASTVASRHVLSELRKQHRIGQVREASAKQCGLDGSGLTEVITASW